MRSVPYDAGDYVVVTGHFSGRAKDTGIELFTRRPYMDAAWRQGGAIPGYTDTANWLYALYRIQVEHPAGV